MDYIFSMFVSSTDLDTHLYCGSALINLALNSNNQAKMIQTGSLQKLVSLFNTTTNNDSKYTCLKILTNLTLDGKEFQL